MFLKLAFAFLLCSSIVNSARVKHSASRKSLAHDSNIAEKTGSGDTASIYISYNETYAALNGLSGNDVGRVFVRFPSGQAVLTSQGFLQYPERRWSDGTILGKADDYVWPIQGGHGAGFAFTFDHGVSDLVFGDARAANAMYRPEFEETIYSNPSGGTAYAPSYSTPQDALRKQLQEESKESALSFGMWQRDGYFQPQGQPKSLRYTPRLKVKDGSNFQKIGRLGSSFQSATLQRPSILDIDNLFSKKPLVPREFRSSSLVEQDRTYQVASAYGQQGLYHGQGNPGQHGGIPGQMGYPGQHGGMPGQMGYPSQHGGMPGQMGHGGITGQMTHGGMPGQMGHGGMPGPMGGQCYPRRQGGMGVGGLIGMAMGKKSCGQKHGEGCTTQQECTARGGRRWKQKGCDGGYQCGCCQGLRTSYLQTNETEVALAEDAENQPRHGKQGHRQQRDRQQHGYGQQPGYRQQSRYGQQPGHGGMGQNTLPVEINVEWLTPVLQKFQCVSVAERYSKAGEHLFIAMGWDTESDIADLDLDLSLVPVDKNKRVIGHKTVFYGQKEPQALNCGRNHYGMDYGMRAFNDDRSGDQPGDDELVKVNLACLNQAHGDIEAFIVTVSIYAPMQLTWNQIDSAYLRIISGGRESRQGDNFFVHSAEAVRSFVRLSGNDLKEDPELQKNTLAVGMFFRQPTGTWAFATLMKGVLGRNAQEAGPGLEAMLTDLVYPANTQWDQTREHSQLQRQGAFGKPGIHGKATTGGLVANGQLPCVASRSDQARVIMGHMTPQALSNVQTNPKVPANVKQFAGAMQANPKVAKQVQGMAQAVGRMEQANTERERKRIAQNMNSAPVARPSRDRSNQAETDLESLFDAI